MQIEFFVAPLAHGWIRLTIFPPPDTRLENTKKYWARWSAGVADSDDCSLRKS